MRPGERLLLGVLLVALAAMAAGLAGLDPWLAEVRFDVVGPALTSVVAVLDLILWKGRADYAVVVVLLIAVPLIARYVGARRARLWVSAAVSAALAIALSHGLKPVFGRVRPYQAQEILEQPDLWFAGGTSFPSGHAGFYAGLFLPLVLIWPRAALVGLLVPLLVVAQRVTMDFHYLSDVSAGVALAAVLTLSVSRIVAPPA
jgi:membrane-associated phospholipid phosphatase